MIARDMIMQLFPQALDHIGVGRIGRQEVEDDPPRQAGQVAQGLA